MSLPNPLPYKCNFRTLHHEHDSLRQEDVLLALENNLFSLEVPYEIVKVIRYIAREYSAIFNPNIKISIAKWNDKNVYLVNSSTTRLDYIGGEVIFGSLAAVKIDAGLVIFARRQYSQALWIFDRKQVSCFGVAR